jgi:hypothetical protein
VEKLAVVKKPVSDASYDGQFYSGDSYIILQTKVRLLNRQSLANVVIASSISYIADCSRRSICDCVYLITTPITRIIVSFVLLTVSPLARCTTLYILCIPILLFVGATPHSYVARA